MSSSKHFAHLHLHTEFSLLDGALRVKDAIKFAEQEKWKAMAITDHGNVFGGVKFFQEAKAHNIKPILGAEMYFTDDVNVKSTDKRYFHLVLLVKNNKGYENLCQLMAYSFREGFYFKPRIDKAALAKYSEGLIASSACLGGMVPWRLRKGHEKQAAQDIEWFLETFGPENYYFELMPPFDDEQIKTNNLLVSYAKQYGVTLAATADAHYLLAEDRDAHEVMLSIQTKDQLSNPNRYSFGAFKGHLKSTNEMLGYFKDNEEAVWNTGKIADRCEFDFELGKLHFPLYDIPKEETEEEHFKRLCLEGLQELYDKQLIPQEQWDTYKERLDTETALISKMGFVSYFLIVSDFIRWGKKEGIAIGPGRGSAAGSLVAWTLQITNIDPIKYNLLFERFLNPERVSMPDIDIDFCIKRREEVINYVREKYGRECVCQIITFGTMMAKGVIKDVARVLGIPFQDANAITELIPDQLKITLQEALDQEPRLKQMVESDPQIKHLFEISFRLEGLTRHASKHAAGVVIAPRPLREMIPLYTPAKSDESVTQFAMTELDQLGFLKMDFLGLKNLTIIDRTVRAIKRNHGIDIDLDKIPLNDDATFELLCAGNCSGVFQFEGDGVTEVIKRLKPDKFEDLIAVNALYRPGPLGSGMVDDFIDRRHGKKKVSYMFSELAPILEETYGVIVYQEQVQKIASVIGGYSLGGADILRRAMGKKKPEEMARQRKIFLEGAKKNGFNEKKADELFELMAYFAGYGFNKSHSAAYALIAYQTAYLKANYPREFIASLLSFEVNNPDQFALYLQRSQALGIPIIAPDINSSDIEFRATPEGIIFGLEGVKNVGLSALENIIASRESGPFKSLADFCERIDLRTVNKRVIESLISAGAFDALDGTRAQKMYDLEAVIKYTHDKKEAARTGQMGLFGAHSPANPDESDEFRFSQVPPWTTHETLEREKQSIGIYLSDHPLTEYQPLADALGARALKHDPEEPSKKGESQVFLGILRKYKVIFTKKGDRMAFGELEDRDARVEVVIFPRIFEKHEELLDRQGPLIIQGNAESTPSNSMKIIAEKIMAADQVMMDQAHLLESITLTLPKKFSEQTCQSLNKLLSEGNHSFNIMFSENEKALTLAANKKIQISLELLKKLNQQNISVRISLKQPPAKKPFKGPPGYA